MKFGVVRFPGTCDDVDAQLAAARVGEAQLLWHADRDLHGVDAVIIPGGFSYGDYLRAGAIARFAPAWPTWPSATGTARKPSATAAGIPAPPKPTISAPAAPAAARRW